MLPFDDYPHGGRQLLGRPRTGDGTCRRGYGLDFQRRTGQTACAYCGISLTDDYLHWLLLALDHIVPAAECARLGIPSAFARDCVNLVLACAGCNGFKNRYQVGSETGTDWTLADFLVLRDCVFTHRARQIARRRAIEQAFFEQQPGALRQ